MVTPPLSSVAAVWVSVSRVPHKVAGVVEAALTAGAVEVMEVLGAAAAAEIVAVAAGAATAGWVSRGRPLATVVAEVAPVVGVLPLVEVEQAAVNAATARTAAMLAARPTVGLRLGSHGVFDVLVIWQRRAMRVRILRASLSCLGRALDY
jgi:hypothetical protein